jgi:predicted transposase/invertase (TIGR01784 family)
MEDFLIKPEEDLLDLKDDVTFKFVFSSERESSRKALSSLISAFTGHEIKKLSVSPNESVAQFLREKQIRFDVCCVFNNGERANVEMCFHPNEDEALRSEFFAARLHTSQESKGKYYDELASSYQISLIDNEELTKDNEIIHVYKFYDEKNKVSLGGKICIIHAELKKLERIPNTVETMDLKEKWATLIKWIKNKEKIDLLNKLIKNEEGLAMAVIALKEIGKDEKERIRIMRMQNAKNDYENGLRRATEKGEVIGFNKGAAAGKKAGKIEGKIERNIEIARHALSLGLNVGQISKLTGLSLDEVNSLMYREK